MCTEQVTADTLLSVLLTHFEDNKGKVEVAIICVSFLFIALCDMANLLVLQVRYVRKQ
jgi:hypothetical protein